MARARTSGDPTSCSACAGDVPTLEARRRRQPAAPALPEVKVRLVNVVD
jgi:phosphoketolase